MAFLLFLLSAGVVTPAFAECDLYVTGPQNALGAVLPTYTWRIEIGNRGSTDCVASGVNTPTVDIPAFVVDAPYNAMYDAFFPYGQEYLGHVVGGPPVSTLAGVVCTFNTLGIGADRKLYCDLPSIVPAGTLVILDVTTTTLRNQLPLPPMCGYNLVADIPRANDYLATPDGNAANNSANMWTAACGGSPTDLRIQTRKTVSATAAYVGETFAYTVILTNTTAADPSDPLAATGGHQLIDQLPANVEFVSVTTPTVALGGFASCSEDAPQHRVVCNRFAALRPGQSATATITVRATATGQAINTCTGAGSGNAVPTPPTVDNTLCRAVTDVSAPTIEVTKDADATTVLAGGAIGWTISVNNTSPVNVNNVSIVDFLPPDIGPVTITSTSFVCTQSAGQASCLAGVLTPGLHTIRLTSTAPAEPTLLTNVCDGSTPSASVIDESCRAVTDVVESSSITVSKTGPVTVPAGAPISWTVTVVSAGPSAATNVVVTDPVPAGVTNLNVSGPAFDSCGITGQTASCVAALLPPGAYTFVVGGTAPSSPQTLTNTCTASAPTATIGGTCTATTVVTESSGITVSKTGPAVVAAGAPINWTVTVVSTGPSAATNVVVTDPVPAGVTGVSVVGAAFDSCGVVGQLVTCSASSLPPGTYTFVVSGTAP
ncbi:MAG TPA: hypothetical protein VJ724_03645, partial [Tahibacter sp.]|nr:hypothetical protein [Tahibacter sp.]